MSKDISKYAGIPEQLQEVREFGMKSLRSDYMPDYSIIEVNKEPYHHMISDVVVIGDGLAGSIASAYLAQKDNKVINLKPHEKRILKTEYALNKREFDNLDFIFNDIERKKLISKIADEGTFAFYDKNDHKPSTQIKTNYVSKNVLDHEIHVEQFFDALDEKFNEKSGVAVHSRYKSIQKYNGYNYITTESGKVIKTKLMISSMGENDPFDKYANPKQKLKYACTYGAVLELKDIKLPNANVLRTINDSENGVQYLFEHFNKEGKTHSTVYAFYIDDKKADFEKLFDEKFISQIEKYTESKIVSIDRLLYGNIPLVKNLLKKKRSAFDGHYTLSSITGMSPNSGCGTQMFRYIGKVCDELSEALNNNKLESKVLNQIKPDNRQLLTWELESFFTNFMMQQKHENIWTPNKQLAFTFKQYFRIDDTVGRNNLLDSHFEPAPLWEMIMDSLKSGDGKEYFSDICSNNGGFWNFWTSINKIMTNYLVEEVKEIIKHEEKGEYEKMKRHIQRRDELKNINIIKPLLLHGPYHLKKYIKNKIRKK